MTFEQWWVEYTGANLLSGDPHEEEMKASAKAAWEYKEHHVTVMGEDVEI